MHIRINHAARPPALLPVRDPADLEFLVKESELLTGRPGRRFVIAGADRLIYRLTWHPLGFTVQRLDTDGRALHAEQLLQFEFLDHSLLEALHAGQLYTPALPGAGHRH
jgi:hypothetical protein